MLDTESEAKSSRKTKRVRVSGQSKQSIGRLLRRYSNPSSHLHFDDNNLTKYESEKLYNWRFMCLLHGTSISVWNIVNTILSCAIASVIGYFNCQQVGIGPDKWKICIPLTNNEALALSSLASFIVSMFVSQIFARWWETRRLLQGIIGGSNGLAMLTSTYILGDDEDGEYFRKTIVRYANLAHAFVYLQAQDEFIVGPLLDAEILMEDEWKLLKSAPGKVNIIYTWMSHILKESAKAGRLYNARLTMPIFTETINKMRGAAGDIGMYLAVQIPYSYTHLVALIVKVHLFLIMLFSSSLIAAGFANKQIERILMGYLVNSVNCILFNALLELHVRLENPFGNDAQDFPKSMYLRNTNQSTTAIIDTPLPEAVARVVISDRDPKLGLSKRFRSKKASTKESDSGAFS